MPLSRGLLASMKVSDSDSDSDEETPIKQPPAATPAVSNEEAIEEQLSTSPATVPQEASRPPTPVEAAPLASPLRTPPPEATASPPATTEAPSSTTSESLPCPVCAKPVNTRGMSRHASNARMSDHIDSGCRAYISPKKDSPAVEAETAAIPPQPAAVAQEHVLTSEPPQEDHQPVPSKEDTATPQLPHDEHPHTASPSVSPIAAEPNHDDERDEAETNRDDEVQQLNALEEAADSPKPLEERMDTIETTAESGTECAESGPSEAEPKEHEPTEPEVAEPAIDEPHDNVAGNQHSPAPHIPSTEDDGLCTAVSSMTPSGSPRPMPPYQHHPPAESRDISEEEASVEAKISELQEKEKRLLQLQAAEREQSRRAANNDPHDPNNLTTVNAIEDESYVGGEDTPANDAREGEDEAAPTTSHKAPDYFDGDDDDAGESHIRVRRSQHRDPEDDAVSTVTAGSTTRALLLGVEAATPSQQGTVMRAPDEGGPPQMAPLTLPRSGSRSVGRTPRFAFMGNNNSASRSGKKDWDWKRGQWDAPKNTRNWQRISAVEAARLTRELNEACEGDHPLFQPVINDSQGVTVITNKPFHERLHPNSKKKTMRVTHAVLQAEKEADAELTFAPKISAETEALCAGRNLNSFMAARRNVALERTEREKTAAEKKLEKEKEFVKERRENRGGRVIYDSLYPNPDWKEKRESQVYVRREDYEERMKREQREHDIQERRASRGVDIYTHLYAARKKKSDQKEPAQTGPIVRSFDDFQKLQAEANEETTPEAQNNGNQPERTGLKPRKAKVSASVFDRLAKPSTVHEKSAEIRKQRARPRSSYAPKIDSLSNSLAQGLGDVVDRLYYGVVPSEQDVSSILDESAITDVDGQQEYDVPQWAQPPPPSATTKPEPGARPLRSRGYY